jgi:hypothetical protein
MTKEIIYGHIDPIWDDEYKSFEYTRQPIKQEEIDKWREMGYTHDTFSGVMYGGNNTMPDWVYTVADRLGLENPGFVFYCMSTMEVMPPHVDHFETYCRVFNITREQVYRGLVMLEDGAAGHYLEMDSKPTVGWRAGDYFLWSADVEHAASNIGTTPRWTLQITGTLKGK